MCNPRELLAHHAQLSAVLCPAGPCGTAAPGTATWSPCTGELKTRPKNSQRDVTTVEGYREMRNLKIQRTKFFRWKRRKPPNCYFLQVGMIKKLWVCTVLQLCRECWLKKKAEALYVCHE